jgi:hypothetical protein
MLLFFLAEFFTVADTDFPALLSKNHERFLFAHFRDSASPESALSASWSEFVRDPPPVPTLALGEVLCSDPSPACANFTSGTFPNAVWLDPAFNITAPFTSADPSADALRAFALAMSTHPFTVGQEWEYARSRSDPWSPVPYIISTEARFSEVFTLLKKVFLRLGKVGVVHWESGLTLQVLRAGFKAVTYKGKWVDDDVYDWLRHATIARCERLTDEMYGLLVEKAKPFVHFFIDATINRTEWLSSIELFPPHQYSYLPYNKSDSFVAKFGVKGRRLPATVYFNPTTGFQRIYNGELTSQALGDWLIDVEFRDPTYAARRSRKGYWQGFMVRGVGLLICVSIVAAVCIPQKRRSTSSAAFARFRAK